MGVRRQGRSPAVSRDRRAGGRPFVFCIPDVHQRAAATEALPAAAARRRNRRRSKMPSARCAGLKGADTAPAALASLQAMRDERVLHLFEHIRDSAPASGTARSSGLRTSGPIPKKGKCRRHL